MTETPSEMTPDQILDTLTQAQMSLHPLRTWALNIESQAQGLDGAVAIAHEIVGVLRQRDAIQKEVASAQAELELLKNEHTTTLALQATEAASRSRALSDQYELEARQLEEIRSEVAAAKAEHTRLLTAVAELRARFS